MVTATRWVEEQIQNDLLANATDRRDTVFRQVLVESIGVLLALVVAITFAVLLARMLARSLLRLRENALQVAERELPETVARLSDPAALGENTPEELAAQVQDPIQLRSRDEIGEVAQAFNMVHREAVRVAAEQAVLRTSVSAMFLSLARRSQSLVDRMIGQLDEIERNEEDPKRLARCSSSTTSPPGCAATTRTSWCSPAPTPARRARDDALARRCAPRRPVRDRALRPDRVRHRRQRRRCARRGGQRRGAADRRAVRQRDPVLPAQLPGGGRGAAAG